MHIIYTTQLRCHWSAMIGLKISINMFALAGIGLRRNDVNHSGAVISLHRSRTLVVAMDSSVRRQRRAFVACALYSPDWQWQLALTNKEPATLSAGRLMSRPVSQLSNLLFVPMWQVGDTAVRMDEPASDDALSSPSDCWPGRNTETAMKHFQPNSYNTSF